MINEYMFIITNMWFQIYLVYENYKDYVTQNSKPVYGEYEQNK